MSLICSRVCVGMVAYTQVHTNCLHMYIPYYHPTCLCVPVCVRVYMMLVHVLAGSRWSISVYGCSGRRSHIPSPHLSLEHLPFPSLPSLSNCPSSLLHTHTRTHTLRWFPRFHLSRSTPHSSPWSLCWLLLPSKMPLMTLWALSPFYHIHYACTRSPLFTAKSA